MAVTTIDMLRARWLKQSLDLEEPASASALAQFIAEYGVCLPVTLSTYFLNLNGNKSLDGLTRLWPLRDINTITNIFWPQGEQYSEYVLERMRREPPAWSSGQRLVSVEQMPSGDYYIECLLPDAEQYFIFGDYNIDAEHWAIKLTPDCESSGHPVMLIAGNQNSYRQVAEDFDDFLNTYLNEEPESLI